MLPTWKDFLLTQSATIVDDTVSHFGNHSLELQAVASSTIIADLSHAAIVAITGDDAQTFLHGQFTNDVSKLVEGNLQLNGYCSPKGRLLASFLLWRQNDCYLMQLPAVLRESVQKRLTMFVLRSKVRLVDASEETIRIGIAGPEAAALINTVSGSPAPLPNSVFQGEKITVLGLEHNRFEILLSPEHAAGTWQMLSKRAVPVGASRWDWLGIHAGKPIITKATQEQFVPQMVNFELIGGVNFQKGCYPGQEIVARTQYLGKLKRRMYLANIAADAADAGDELFSPEFENQACGTVVNTAPSPNGGVDVLAVIQIESAENHSVRLGSSNGPLLRLLPLPYPLA